MKKNKNIVVWSNCPQPPTNLVEHWHDPLENVLISLGYEMTQPPLANLLKWYHSLTGDWFVVSPVYFHTTHNDSVIAQYGTGLDLNDEKGRWYFDKVSEFLQEEGIRLHYHSPTLWLGQSDDIVSINSYSPSYLHNKSILPYLEKLSEDMSWQKRITETQMFLQTLHLTGQNNSNINGLWFWGQGELSIHLDIILSDDTKMMHLTEVWPELMIQTCFEETHVNAADYIFLTEYTDETFRMIENVCRSHPCNWYWNNIIYQQPAKHWWQMFRRKRL